MYGEKMADIDFKNLRRIPEGNRNAFEELVCQIVERFVHLPPQSPYHVPTGSSFHRFEGAGGDGGVECIWQLPSGKKRGYQAKLFSRFSSSEKQQMAKSIKSAILNHEELEYYTFLFPINLTGPTGRATGSSNRSAPAPGGSATEKLLDWTKEWRKHAASNGREVKIDWLGKTSISNLLISLDPAGELRRYWFPDADFKKMADAIVGGMSKLNLRLPILQGSKHSRFTYAARRTKLYGRDKELNALKEFIDDPSEFSWMCIVGSGGKGKSRLALEFCISVSNEWDSGFITDIAGIDWIKWQPLNPTLIVVDYAAQLVADLNNLAFSLATRSDLKKPVRLILLERDVHDDWKNGFLTYGTRRNILLTRRFSDDMVLSGLSDTDLWNLIQESFLIEGQTSCEVSEDIVADVVRIDPQRRPLFALLAADALNAGRHIRSWDREALLTDVLQRDMQAFWNPAGVNRKDYNLLATSTLCGGIHVGALADIQNVIDVPSINEYDPLKLAAMTGVIGYDDIPALVPDILGSFFVLTHLKPKHGADFRARTFRDVAWTLNPKRTSAFLVRTLMDFPDHPCTIPLLEHIRPSGKEEASSWALLTGYRAFWEAKREEDGAARLLVEEIEKLLTDEDDEDVVGAFAMAVLAQATNALQKGSYQSVTYWVDYAIRMASTLPNSGIMVQCVSMILGLSMQLVAAVEGVEVVKSYLEKVDDMILGNGKKHDPAEETLFMTVAAAALIARNDKKWCQRAFTYYERQKPKIIEDIEASRQMTILLSLILDGAIQHDNGVMAERVIKILKEDLLLNLDPVIASYFCMSVGHLMMKTPDGMKDTRINVIRSKAASLLEREDVFDALTELLSSRVAAREFKRKIEVNFSV